MDANINANNEAPKDLDPETMMWPLEEEMKVDEMAQQMFESSSDEDDKESRKGKAPNKERDFLGATACLNRDYLNSMDKT